MVSARTVDDSTKGKLDMIRVSVAGFALFSFIGLANAQQPAPKGNYAPTQTPGAIPAPASPAAPAVAGLSTPKQKASYGIGTGIGAQMRETQLGLDDIDMAALVRGITD